MDPLNNPPISDNHRRMICRSSFILFCFVPTFAVFYLILHPFSTHDWEQLIEAKSGFAVEIDSVENVGPWETVLRDVKLSDVELGELITATEVRIRIGDSIDVTVEHPTKTRAVAIHKIAESLQTKLIRSHAIDRPIKFRFLGAMNIRSEQSPENLVAHSIEIDVFNDEGNCANIFMKTGPPDNPNAPIEAAIHRQLDTNGETIKAFFFTQNQEVPCWLLTGFAPQLEQLGKAASFNGVLECRSSNSDSGQNLDTFLSGRFQRIDLSKVTRETSQISGYANAAINCKIHNDKIHEFHTNVDCTNGEFSKEFLAIAENHLGLRVDPDSRNLDTPFDSLKFGIDYVEGRVSYSSPNGVFAFDVNGRSLVESRTPLDCRLQDLASYLFPKSTPAELNNQQVKFLSYFHLPESTPIRTASKPFSNRH